MSVDVITVGCSPLTDLLNNQIQKDLESSYSDELVSDIVLHGAGVDTRYYDAFQLNKSESTVKFKPVHIRCKEYLTNSASVLYYLAHYADTFIAQKAGTMKVYESKEQVCALYAFYQSNPSLLPKDLKLQFSFFDEIKKEYVGYKTPIIGTGERDYCYEFNHLFINMKDFDASNFLSNRKKFEASFYAFQEKIEKLYVRIGKLNSDPVLDHLIKDVKSLAIHSRKQWEQNTFYEAVYDFLLMLVNFKENKEKDQTVILGTILLNEALALFSKIRTNNSLKNRLALTKTHNLTQDYIPLLIDVLRGAHAKIQDPFIEGQTPNPITDGLNAALKIGTQPQGTLLASAALGISGLGLVALGVVVLASPGLIIFPATFVLPLMFSLMASPVGAAVCGALILLGIGALLAGIGIKLMIESKKAYTVYKAEDNCAENVRRVAQTFFKGEKGVDALGPVDEADLMYCNNP